ncbi:MAG: hypothetical protein Q8R28_03340, partial [Dehalococcoidia bacterium]|nr:hypothetical protein [Dehalococcoidia bacterium]
LFDAVIAQMLTLSASDAPSEGLSNWLAREHPLDTASMNIVIQSYGVLRKLQKERRDHIWGFVARNLVRPVWLSQEDQRVDVVIGNPPWLSYRYMQPETQKRFREECLSRGLWMGGKVATHQDLSAYFFVRCVELYLKQEGLIAFVMPYAAMTRRQFAGFRTGIYGERKGNHTNHVFATVQFTEAWTLRDEVAPLFPLPSCALFARSGEAAQGGPLPLTVKAARGTLPRRDASPEEAGEALSWKEAPWPASLDGDTEVSPYSDAFKQGATMVPRVLCVVEEAVVSGLGGNVAAPVVQSRRTSQEKAPWKGLPMLRGNVEQEFLRPLYLGESAAPFRLLKPVSAVIPWSEA